MNRVSDRKVGARVRYKYFKKTLNQYYAHVGENQTTCPADVHVPLKDPEMPVSVVSMFFWTVEDNSLYL